MSTSRDRLDMMENNKPESKLSFLGDGMFVRRRVVACVGVLFVTSVVGVALLVYYLAPCPSERSEKSGQHQGDASAESGSSTTTKTTSTTTTTTSPKLDVRLPRTLRPIHYDLRLQPYLDVGNFTFDGKVAITLECVSPVNVITLHVLNLTILRESITLGEVDGRGDSVPAVTGLKIDAERQFLLVSLDGPLRSKGRYVLNMTFVGYLGENLAGFYRSSYGDGRWLATSQFQPTDARRAFPCFDEPGLKATFAVTLVRPETMSSLSNMPIEKTVSIGNGWAEDQFKTSVNMSTYLLAFVVSDFKKQSNNLSQPEFRVWSRPEAIGQTDYALEIGPKVLAFFETFFNVTYPLPKQDMIAIPDFSAGAMENWGLITYRETALLYDNNISATSSRQRIAVVISHELAHQWFGNLVTPQWWDDLWLNEGFASYVEYLGVDHVHPDWKMMDQFVTLDLHDVMELDSLQSSHPVSVPVDNPDEISEIFDQISYGKGASIIRMMDHFLGRKIFKEGLTNYLNSKKFDNAVQDDLWQHLTDAAKNRGQKDMNVKRVMDTWTLQTGFPVVTVIRNYDQKNANVTQRRFLLKSDPASDHLKTETKWEIPVSFTTKSKGDFLDTRPDVWLHQDTESKILTVQEGLPENKNDWVMFNIQQTGFYRVNYDEGNWALLSEQLQTNHTKIHEINRAQLMDDALDLAKAGLLKYQTAMETTLYLHKEMDYVPWRAVLDSFLYLDTMLSRSAAYGMWTNYVIKKITPLYNEVGFEEGTSSDSHLRKLTRALVLSWACDLELPHCVNSSKQLYKDWMATNSSARISPNLKRTIGCTAVANGGYEEWEFAWNQYLISNVGSEKDTLLSVLACSKQPWILSKYLNMAIDPNTNIRRQDMSTVIRTVSSNKIGRYMSLDFIRDKWNVFKDTFAGAFTLASLVKGVMSGLNTPFELRQLREFAKFNEGNLSSAERAIQQVMEETEANVKWMSDNYITMEDWLRNNI